MAFALTLRARLSLAPTVTGIGILTTRQASLHVADRWVAPPCNRGFDAGLRPRAFPPDTASLLPGLLTVTRTGLTPASDDELTTEPSTVYTTNLQAFWTHKEPAMTRNTITLTPEQTEAFGRELHARNSASSPT